MAHCNNAHRKKAHALIDKLQQEILFIDQVAGCHQSRLVPHHAGKDADISFS